MPTTNPIAADFDVDAFVAMAARAEERRRALEPPPEDPAIARARLLADRAQVLIAGGFGRREVDRCRPDDPGLTRALEHARAFVAQTERAVLVLLGGTGTGKTTAATWIAREVGGSRPVMVAATTLERRGRYDTAFAARLDTATLVVLDDLGVEPMDAKGYFAALVDELVDRAYRDHRRLVVTSNADLAELRDRLGARVGSRFVQAAMTAACGDVDLRRPVPTLRATGGGR